MKQKARLLASQSSGGESFAPLQATDSLESESRKAAVIIKGRVIAAGIKVEEMQSGTISEHDPLLRKAIVETDEILKGPELKKRWTIFYATSNDVLWFHAPKLKRGEAAIFLLQLNQPPYSGPSNYTVLNALDVQPLTASTQIKMLLNHYSPKSKKTSH